jgi:hypothetical protein
LERSAVRQNLSIQIARKCRRGRPVRRVHKLIEGVQIDDRSLDHVHL